MGATPDTPLVAGPLYGLRTWSVVGEGDHEGLAGPHRSTPWPEHGAWLDATCSREPGHHAPEHDCICGIHAFHPDADGARRALASRRDVAGIVEASGRVEVHPEGFRAERGRPYALVVTPGRNARLVERLAQTYDAEVAEVGGPAELVSWCRERSLGLGAAAVAEIVGADRIAAWLADRRRRRRIAVLRVVALLLVAFIMFGVAFVAFPDPKGPHDVFGRTGRIHIR